MAQEIIEAVRDRFSLADKNKYIIQGNLPRDCEVEVYLDQEKQENFTVKRDVEQSAVEIQLPEDLSGYKKLSVFVPTRCSIISLVTPKSSNNLSIS